MPKRVKTLLQIIVILIIIGGIGWYFYSDYIKSAIPWDEKTKTINQIATLKIYNTDSPEDELDYYKEVFEENRSIFIKSPESADAFWALIAIEQIKQIVGDYDGAEQALLYAVELQPKSYVANGNLAALYFRHYKNFEKAEEYYLKAVEADSPQVIPYYLDLYEIYRYFYKTDTSLAEDILKQGIEKYSDDSIDLVLILAYHYKKLGMYDQARTYYLMALSLNPDSQTAKKGLESLE